MRRLVTTQPVDADKPVWQKYSCPCVHVSHAHSSHAHSRLRGNVACTCRTSARRVRKARSTLFGLCTCIRHLSVSSTKTGKTLLGLLATIFHGRCTLRASSSTCGRARLHVPTYACARAYVCTCAHAGTCGHICSCAYVIRYNRGIAYRALRASQGAKI